MYANTGRPFSWIVQALAVTFASAPRSRTGYARLSKHSAAIGSGLPRGAGENLLSVTRKYFVHDASADRRMMLTDNSERDRSKDGR